MTTGTLICFLLSATFGCGAAGNYVVIGILGSSVSIECSLPLSETLVWEDSRGNGIAMHGIVSGSMSRKYVIEKQNVVREILVIHELTLEDEMQYRCYDLRNTTATEVFKLQVLNDPMGKPVSTRKANTTAYIAGGVTAMVGLFFITAAVVFVVRRDHKQCRTSDVPSSLEELEKRSKQERDNQRTGIPTLSTKSIWKAIRSIGKPIDKARRLFNNLRRCEVVTTLDDTHEDVTFQQTQVIASTPYNTLKHYQQDSEQSLPVSLMVFQPRRSTNKDLNILRSSSGLILSPILIHFNNSRTVFNQEIDNQISRDDDFGQSYSTADIVDVLGETKKTMFTSRLECTDQKEETVGDGLVTRNKDYSADDILEVLGDCETHLGDSIQISYPYSEITESACELTIHTWNGCSISDFSKFNLFENDSHTCKTFCSVTDKPCDNSRVCGN